MNLLRAIRDADLAQALLHRLERELDLFRAIRDADLALDNLDRLQRERDYPATVTPCPIGSTCLVCAAHLDREHQAAEAFRTAAAHIPRWVLRTFYADPYRRLLTPPTV